eukprot:TRINITY_DN5360_c0_g1_i1.p1 TRINITY_DN5360_c0_g1~~TRINITY_DN5360_c0_g1_i1.p1  ORF type:complete len:254 (+),score=82.77 TRINITY_DN5360_c0_g1_i1:10-771(+)
MEGFSYKSREVILQVLEEFFKLFTSQDFIAELKGYAPDENKIAQVIEDRQREILTSHGINPTAGLRDLSRVRVFFQNDKEVCQKLVYVCTREEMLTNEVLGTAPPGQVTPGSLQEMHSRAAENMPQFMNILQQGVQMNPQLISQMSPQQLAQYQALMMMSKQQQNPMAMMGQAQSNPNPQTTAPTTTTSTTTTSTTSTPSATVQASTQVNVQQQQHQQQNNGWLSMFSGWFGGQQQNPPQQQQQNQPPNDSLD